MRISLHIFSISSRLLCTDKSIVWELEIFSLVTSIHACISITTWHDQFPSLWTVPCCCGHATAPKGARLLIAQLLRRKREVSMHCKFRHVTHCKPRRSWKEPRLGDWLRTWLSTLKIKQVHSETSLPGRESLLNISMLLSSSCISHIGILCKWAVVCYCKGGIR